MDAGASATSQRLVDQRFLFRVFYAFAALAIVSVAINVAGKWAGRAIVTAGHTADRTLHEIVIGNEVFIVPANMIRWQKARVDGVAPRLDLYLRWPDMAGYTDATRDDFNHAGGRQNILFLSIERRAMSRDMSGRFEPIYRSLIGPESRVQAGGVRLHAFTEKSGYLNEELAVAERPGRDPFVARCLTGAAAETSLAPCQRDVQVGDDLSLAFRFPAALLAEWPALDRAIAEWTKRHMRTAK